MKNILVLKNDNLSKQLSSASVNDFNNIVGNTIELIIENEMFFDQIDKNAYSSRHIIYLFTNLQTFSEVRKYVLDPLKNIQNDNLDQLKYSFEQLINTFHRYFTDIISQNNKKYGHASNNSQANNQKLLDNLISIQVSSVFKLGGLTEFGENSELAIKNEFLMANKKNKDYVTFF